MTNKAALDALDFLEEHCWVDDPAEEVARLKFKTIRAALTDAPSDSNICDKDPQSCWSVRCHLGKQCAGKNRFDVQPSEEDINAGNSWKVIRPIGEDVREANILTDRELIEIELACMPRLLAEDSKGGILKFVRLCKTVRYWKDRAAQSNMEKKI